MKLTLSLWIASVLLSSGAYERQHRIRWIAPESIAQERFQAGPFLLEFRVQDADHNEANEPAWPVSSIGLNTDFAVSLAPFSIRIILVLNLGKDRTAIAAGALREQITKTLPLGEGFCCC